MKHELPKWALTLAVAAWFCWGAVLPMAHGKGKPAPPAAPHPDRGLANYSGPPIHMDGFLTLSGGGYGTSGNTSYGRQYRDLENPAAIGRLDLRYFNDPYFSARLLGQDLGSLNSRWSGVAFFRNHLRLEATGGRISHTTTHRTGWKTQRDWMALQAQYDFHPHFALRYKYDGHDRNGFAPSNFLDHSFQSHEIGVDYLCLDWSGQIFWRDGRFDRARNGNDQTEFGITLGKDFGRGTDHLLMSLEQDTVQSQLDHATKLKTHSFASVYTLNPHRFWTVRGSFQGTTRDSQIVRQYSPLAMSYDDDTQSRNFSLDIAYHGFKSVRARSRITGNTFQRFSHLEHQLPDSQRTTIDVFLANRAKAPLSWNLRLSASEQDGGNLRYLDANPLKKMDYFPATSHRRRRALLGLAHPALKDKLLVSATASKDWTEYDRSPTMGVNHHQMEARQVDVAWMADDRLSVSAGIGASRSDFQGRLLAWRNSQFTPTLDSYLAHDLIQTWSLGYVLGRRTHLSIDLLNVTSKNEGFMNSARFRELEQRYELDRRLSKNARLGLRYTHSWYDETVHHLEDGRVQRWDIDYRIEF